MHDAQAVDGVFEVIDELKVHPPITGRLGDDAIRAAALEKLASDSPALARHVDVSVDDGWVTLTGYVRQEAERSRAEADVAGLEGVAGVINRVAVR